MTTSKGEGEGRRQLAQTLIKLGKSFATKVDTDMVDTYWRGLRNYPIDALLAAIDAHVADTAAGSFFPRPADILRKLPADPRRTHISSDEAWALAIKAHDEGNTIVWTTVIQKAWTICAPIYAAGDIVGARIAFRSAYERLLTDAKARCELPQWVVSLGWDASQRRSAVESAINAGHIARDQAAKLIAPSSEAGTPIKLLGLLKRALKTSGEGGGEGGSSR